MESPSLTVTEKATSSGMRVLIKLSGVYLLLNCPRPTFWTSAASQQWSLLRLQWQRKRHLQVSVFWWYWLNCPRIICCETAPALPFEPQQHVGNGVALDHRVRRREGDVSWYVLCYVISSWHVWVYDGCDILFRVACVIGDFWGGVGFWGEVWCWGYLSDDFYIIPMFRKSTFIESCGLRILQLLNSLSPIL